jgi:uncharacterized protein YndB with AHSA1/START domain
MERPDFAYVIYIAATPEKLWDALTDGHLSRAYWGGRAVASGWQVGSPVLYRISHRDGAPDPIRGTVLAIDPPWRLVMSWRFELGDGQPLTPATRVAFTIERAGPENVKLTVLHEPMELGSTVDEDVRAGWPAILSSLKSYLETGTALDVTRRWAKEGR